jgi:nucleoid DNA-binding protein
MKERIVKRIIAKEGCSRENAKSLYDAICNEIKEMVEELETGKKIPIFGMFSVAKKVHKAHAFLNISTKKKETTPERTYFRVKLIG